MRAWDKSVIHFFKCLTAVAPAGWRIALLLAVVALAVFSSDALGDCTCGGGDGKPTLFEPLTIDGDVTDWGIVLADQDNNVCDGPSGGIVDLDAPVGSNGQDIVQFTFTYDETWLYFYTERAESDNNVQNFGYYADVDNDGFMEEGEPVVWAEWKGSNRNVDVYICEYDPADTVNGDPMVDLSGFGDGYALPGNLQNIPKQPDYSGTWGSTNGSSMEFGVEWSILGFSGPVGHTLHISSSNANKNASNLGSQIDDNLGGCGGGAGTLQFADLEFSGAYSLSGCWGDTAEGLHHLVNLGNWNDSFSFAFSISGSWSPSISLYADDGNGIFSTYDTPIASTVGLAGGQSVDVIIVYGMGSFISGPITVVTTAISRFNAIVTDSVTDGVDVLYPNITLVKFISSVADTTGATPVGVDKALPGAVVTYTVSITNSGNAPPETDSIFITENIPDPVQLFVGAGSVSPVTFDPGTTTLNYTFSSLESTTDDLAFTSQSGPSPAYTYTPVPDPQGFDGAVKGFRIDPHGALDGSTGFDLTYEVGIL